MVKNTQVRGRKATPSSHPSPVRQSKTRSPSPMDAPPAVRRSARLAGKTPQFGGLVCNTPAKGLKVEKIGSVKTKSESDVLRSKKDTAVSGSPHMDKKNGQQNDDERPEQGPLERVDGVMPLAFHDTAKHEGAQVNEKLAVEKYDFPSQKKKQGASADLPNQADGMGANPMKEHPVIGEVSNNVVVPQTQHKEFNMTGNPTKKTDKVVIGLLGKMIPVIGETDQQESEGAPQKLLSVCGLETPSPPSMSPPKSAESEASLCESVHSSVDSSDSDEGLGALEPFTDDVVTESIRRGQIQYENSFRSFFEKNIGKGVVDHEELMNLPIRSKSFIPVMVEMVNMFSMVREAKGLQPEDELYH